jgi:D-glycero-alpha-D-manno-heptose-7-phosphate kinase
MIISRTPYRISFFGGGTDYPVWYKENKGAVLSTTIDKYCYITGWYLSPFFDYTNRIVWSQIEMVKDISEIKHPAVRESLKFMNLKRGVEVHHAGDLPARTGLGSSSSFTVGLLHTLYALKGNMPSKMQLAKDAIHVEQNLLKENVGSQDQVSVAFGGFNKIEFFADNDPHVTPIIMKNAKLQKLQDNMMLVFTGFARTASEIAEEQIKNTPRRANELKAMCQMVDEAIDTLKSGDLIEFGKLLHESWQLKRSLSDKITTPEIDDIYDTARRAGAIGGKLLGAGGGGFLLLFAEPGVQSRIKDRLSHLLHVPFRFENQGSQIIFYAPAG